MRAVEDAVRDRQGGKPKGDDKPPAPNPKLPPPGLLELESLLAEFLATKVHVSMNGKRGRIGIEFADLEDLERIYRRMTGSL